MIDEKNQKSIIIGQIFGVLTFVILGCLLYSFRESIITFTGDFIGGWIELLIDVVPIAISIFIVYKVYSIYRGREDYLNLLLLVNKTCERRFENLYHKGIKLKQNKKREFNPKYIRETPWDYFQFINFDGVSLLFNSFESDKELRNIKIQLRNIIKDPVEKGLALAELQRMHKKYSCVVCNRTALNHEGVENPKCDRCSKRSHSL